MAVFISVIAGVIGAAPKILSLFAPLKKHMSYASRCNDFVRDLGVEVRRLNEEMESLQRRIGSARQNLEVIRPSFEDLIRRVNEMITEASRILDTAPEVQNCTCPSGTYPNLKSRYSLGKQAKKMTEDVKQLREGCGKFERVSDPVPPTGTETIPRPTPGTLEFESRKLKEEEIMECLRDDKILMIGICGMGGVGKTTMVDKIGRRAREEKLFDVIVKPVVSQQVDILQIQKLIAERLGLALENEENESVRANRLHERLLLSPKKVLLYFDDVWEWLDLGKIGIPPQCKMILTSRDQHVFEQMMTKEEARKILKLDTLSEDESWELFREKAGSIVDEPHLRQSAVEVAKECKGLPLALAIVGRAMSGETNKAAWEDALLQLGRAVPTNIPGVIKYVYQPLMLSYHALQSKEAKDFFLLCCLFLEDSNIPIKNLVYYGVALGIFSGTTTIREARNRAQNLVKMLKKCFLLMDADDSDHTRVKMHDVVRDMAVSIASGDEHGFMVSHYTEAWPENVSPENCTCIYLIFLRREAVLPKTLKYPRLEALHLQFPISYEQTRFPESFFDGMTGLRFLCIKNAMPSPTLRMLTQLRVLILPYCESKMIYEIGELVNLEVLRLYGSYIEILPKEIKELTKLKLLDLNDSLNLKKIAPGVVSSLSQLEEIGLDGCPIEWEVGERGSERSNASLTDVSSLRNLSLLDIQIGGEQALSMLGMEKFYRDILIGNHKCLRTLKIGSLQGLRTLFSPEVLRGLINLTKLEVFNCPMLEEIIELEKNEEQRGNKIKKTIIPQLCYLRLSRLPKIRYFCTFSNALELPSLEWLTIQECPMMMIFALESGNISMPNSIPRSFFSKEVICPILKRLYLKQLGNRSLSPLFSPEFFRDLINLTQLEVFDCPMLEEIIEFEENEEQRGKNMIKKTIFPQLWLLKLSRLPKIRYFCTFSNALELPSLLDLTIEECPMMIMFVLESCDGSMSNSIPRSFFSKQVICPNLARLHLRQLKIGTLRTLFASKVFRGLIINLERLLVFDCPMLEEIIELEKNEEQRGRNMIEKTIIPRLKFLKLSRLPKIRYFCTFRNALELPSLEWLTIQECPMMMTFALESGNVIMPNSIPGSFLSKEVICPNLKGLDLRHLRIGYLITLFSLEVFRGLMNLKRLEVFDCPMLEEIIELEKNEEQRERNIIEKTIIPRLWKLELKRLPKIRYFCTFSNALELPSLEDLTIEECPMMMTFALESCNSSMPNSIPRVFFSKQVICPNLERLHVTSCPNLKSLFSSGILGGLTNLQGLEITDCSMLEEVIAKKRENIHIGEVHETNVVWNLSKLERLTLSGLPRMYGFFKIHNSLELPLLSMITIRECPEVKNSLSLGLRCLPKGVKIHGITDPKDASRFLFNKELTEDEDSLNHGRFEFFQSDLSFDPSGRELYLVKGLSNDFFFDGWKDAHGEIEIEMLSLGITYEIVFIIMLVKQEDLVAYSGLKLIISLASDMHEKDMTDKLTEEWIEILGGEFTPTSGQHGQLRFSIAKNDEYRNGVLLKGVYIRPKEIIGKEKLH